MKTKPIINPSTRVRGDKVYLTISNKNNFEKPIYRIFRNLKQLCAFFQIHQPDKKWSYFSLRDKFQNLEDIEHELEHHEVTIKILHFEDAD